MVACCGWGPQAHLQLLQVSFLPRELDCTPGSVCYVGEVNSPRRLGRCLACMSWLGTMQELRAGCALVQGSVLGLMVTLRGLQVTLGEWGVAHSSH